MKKKSAFIVLLFSMFIATFQSDIYAQNITTEQYIAKYKNLAIKSMREYKIPASIKLAQGIIETSSGNSRLATQANNHFGIKCKSYWTGGTIYHDDDEKGECFRSYDSSEDSYNDHSVFLTNSSRYDALFTYDITDYESWAKGLKAAGYATNPKYPLLLIKVIEDYSLYEIDDIVLEGKKDDDVIVVVVDEDEVHVEEEVVVKPTAVVVSVVSNKKKPRKSSSLFNRRDKVAVPNGIYDGPKLDVSGFRAVKSKPRAIYKSNNVLFTIAREGDSFKTIGDIVNRSSDKIMANNEIAGSDIKITNGSVVYLSRKSNKSMNGFEIHTVRRGETLHFISQTYGIKISRLAKINGVPVSYKVTMGQRIKLL